METKTELKEEAKTEITNKDTANDDQLKVIEVLETKRVGRKLGSKNKKKKERTTKRDLKLYELELLDKQKKITEQLLNEKQKIAQQPIPAPAQQQQQYAFPDYSLDIN